MKIGEVRDNTMQMLRLCHCLPAYRCAQIFVATDDGIFKELSKEIRDKIIYLSYNRVNAKNATGLITQLSSTNKVFKAECINKH